jgi:hypothetical protein
MLGFLRPSVIGQAVRLKVSDVGYATRLFFKLLGMFGSTFRRARLLCVGLAGVLHPAALRLKRSFGLDGGFVAGA